MTTVEFQVQVALLLLLVTGRLGACGMSDPVTGHSAGSKYMRDLMAAI